MNILGKLLSIIQKIRRLYWWLIRPETEGVRAIIRDESGRILLVNHRYRAGWFLPGGKVKRNEDYLSALRREIREELGITKIKQLEEFGRYTNEYEYKKDKIVVFTMEYNMSVDSLGFEINGADFFNPNQVPENTSPGTTRRLEEYMGDKKTSREW